MLSHVETISSSLRSELPGLRAYARLMKNDVIKADILVADTLKRAVVNGYLLRDGSRTRVPLFAILHKVIASNRDELRHDVGDMFLTPENSRSRPVGIPVPRAGADLEHTLMLLDHEEREAIILCVAARFTNAETAEICACPPVTVQYRTDHGLARLAELLPAPEVQ
jgi:DNA-directed RNA polymerase specialized sigma24 family protein